MRRLTIKRPVGTIAVSYHGESDASRPPILFVHPINLQGAAWAEIVPAFANRFTIVPDMRGFGDSPPAEQYDLARWAQDCIDAVDRAGVDRFHAIGGSLGGAISLYLAAAEPKRVISVVAVGSQLYSRDPDKRRCYPPSNITPSPRCLSSSCRNMRWVQTRLPKWWPRPWRCAIRTERTTSVACGERPARPISGHRWLASVVL
ncbi:pimeloyl-ACP methyl ester carboxylesterase [Bradyrhizobium sp. LM2.7]